MKLCVTSTGKDLDAMVNEHFGKADYFLIVNTETMKVLAIPNTAHSPGRGTGAGAAQLVLDNGADTVLTGVIGLNAFNALKVGLVDIYEGASPQETVREAVERFKKGEYRECSAPTGGPSYRS
jgi:predicted Fe-Mo cluster-binding NifX family protein